MTEIISGLLAAIAVLLFFIFKRLGEIHREVHGINDKAFQMVLELKGEGQQDSRLSAIRAYLEGLHEELVSRAREDRAVKTLKL